MKKQIYTLQDLPMEELQKLGLAKNGRIEMDEDDVEAMLSGRRTDMLRLEKLTIDGLRIDLLDAKLSLKPNAEGAPGLLLHPIYREPEVPQFLDDTQAQMLEKGDVPNIPMTIIGDDGKPKEVLVEFDKDTNEFVVTDTERVLSPEEINGIPLTAEQKEKYRKGKAVETTDGTTIQYSGTEKQGIRSDKLALVASVLIDGGISYVLYKGLHALFGKKQDKEAGKNFEKAFAEFQKAQAKQNKVAPAPAKEEEQAESISR
jgi:hypothetical protein